THGFALVGDNDIWMSGRSAYYVEMAARAGLIGIHTVAAPPSVAPLGGAKAMLGTNPIAFGFPMEGDPLVIDLGTSAFMGTDLKFRERLGIPLPEGVAIDEHGRPTTDAAAARSGALLPFGGHKGYALALALHALGVSAEYLFIAFKPDLFVPLEDYRRSLAAEIAAIKATPRQDGVDEIRIPGERACRARASRSTVVSTTRSSTSRRAGNDGRQRPLERYPRDRSGSPPGRTPLRAGARSSGRGSHQDRAPGWRGNSVSRAVGPQTERVLGPVQQRQEEPEHGLAQGGSEDRPA